MPASPAPADPGRDDDLAWLDRDPMTAAERQASLDRLCEQDEGHLQDEDEYADVEPLTPEELAEIREAAADELLAVEAATTGRRGPGQPGSARVFPGQSSSPAAAFGPGMPLDVLPGCPQLAVAADAAAGRTAGSPGCPRLSWSGWCARGTGSRPTPRARKLAAIAELARRNPAPEDGEFTADLLAYALASPAAGPGTWSTWPRPCKPGCPAPPRRWTTAPSPGTRPRSSPGRPRCSMTPGPAPPRKRSWTGPAG